MQSFLVCRITFHPESLREQATLEGIVLNYEAELKANQSVTFSDNQLSLGGWGPDHRCDICHNLRAKAKAKNILFLVRCPYEKDDSFSWRIQVGDSFFDISLLYREGYYQEIKRQDPGNLLVRTHLAVIAEYYGRYATALMEYLFVIRNDKSDTFAQKRFKAVSKMLLEKKKREQKQQEQLMVTGG